MSLCPHCSDSSEPATKRQRVDVEKFDVGTLVWARLPDSVWWPAMIEMKSTSFYRISFFGDECCFHGVVSALELLPFNGREDYIDDEPAPGDSLELRTPLQVAVSLARRAMTRSCEERAQALRTRDHVTAEQSLHLLPEVVAVEHNHVQQEIPNRDDASLLGEIEQGVGNAPGEGDDAGAELDSDTESASSTPSVAGDSAYGADSDDSFGGGEWAAIPPLEPVSAYGWEPPSEEAVVPRSEEAVYPDPGSALYDAVVPWDLDEDDDDDDDDEDDDWGQGWPSSEAVVPSDDDDDEDEDDEDDDAGRVEE